jgi:hypothetical protein
MFIEWISTTAKREYIDDYIRKINRGRVGLEKMKDARVIEHAECFRIEGLGEYVNELEYDNIFVRFYSSMLYVNKKQVLVHDCFVFSFGDVACDIYKHTLTGVTAGDVPIKFYDFLMQHEGDFFSKDKKFDVEYAKKFILPNMMPQQREEYYKMLKQKQKEEVLSLKQKHEEQMEKVYNLKNTKQSTLFDEKGME